MIAPLGRSVFYLVSARKPLQSTIPGFSFRRACASASGSDAVARPDSPIRPQDRDLGTEIRAPWRHRRTGAEPCPEAAVLRSGSATRPGSRHAVGRRWAGTAETEAGNRGLKGFSGRHELRHAGRKSGQGIPCVRDKKRTLSSRHLPTLLREHSFAHRHRAFGR